MYSLVLMMALTQAGEAPSWGRHGGHAYGCCGCYGYTTYGCCGCYGGYYAPGPAVPATGPGASDGADQQTGGTADTKGDSPEDMERFRAAAKDAGLSDADVDGILRDAKGAMPAKDLTNTVNDFKKEGIKGDALKKGLSDVIKKVKAATPPEAKLSSAPATFVVHLPADAKLMIDDYVAKATSATRIFVSPALRQGRDYHYTLTAEFDRDGGPATVTRRITVRAGEQTEVTLDASLVAEVARK